MGGYLFMKFWRFPYALDCFNLLSSSDEKDINIKGEKVHARSHLNKWDINSVMISRLGVSGPHYVLTPGIGMVLWDTSHSGYINIDKVGVLCEQITNIFCRVFSFPLWASLVWSCCTNKPSKIIINQKRPRWRCWWCWTWGGTWRCWWCPGRWRGLRRCTPRGRSSTYGPHQSSSEKNYAYDRWFTQDYERSAKLKGGKIPYFMSCSKCIKLTKNTPSTSRSPCSPISPRTLSSPTSPEYRTPSRQRRSKPQELPTPCAGSWDGLYLLKEYLDAENS